MRAKILLVVLSLALVGLAGCLDDYGGSPGAVDPPPSETERSDGGTGDPPPMDPGPEDPPTSREPAPPLNASLTPSRTNGTGPLNVTFLVEGEGRGVLTWSFDVDGDGVADAEGSDLPTNVTHVYEVGTYNATLTVSDANATMDVLVQVSARAPPPVPPPDPIWINGTITGLWLYGVGYLPGDQNRSFELPVPVANFTVHLAFDDRAVDLDFEVYAPDGRQVGRQANINEPTGATELRAGEPPIHVRDDDARETGTWWVRVMPALAVEGEYKVRVVFT